MSEKTKYFQNLVANTRDADTRTTTRLLYYQVFHTMCDMLELKGWKAKSRIGHTKIRQRFVKMFNISEGLKNDIIDWKNARENVDYIREESGYFPVEKLLGYNKAMSNFLQYYPSSLLSRTQLDSNINE